MRRDAPAMSPGLALTDDTAARRLAAPAILTRAFVAGLVALGAALAARSLFLGITLSRPMPAYDQWAVVSDLSRVARGDYSLLDIIAQHNEHRIFTARLNFVLDAYVFHLGNLSVVVASYGLVAALAAVLAVAAARGRGPSFHLVAFSLGLAALWSLAGWRNLGWSFQIAWFYLHLLSALALVFFVRGARRAGPEAWGWLALACLCDILAVYSLSSGLVTVVPVIAAAVWMRCRWPYVLAFAAFHAGATLCFLHGYTMPPQQLVLDPVRILKYLAPYLGTAFPGSKRLAITLGGIGLLAALVLLAVATVRWALRGRKADPGLVVLLGIVLFVLAEGVVTAFGRAGLDDPTGLALRYGTPSQVFWTALALAVWRGLDQVAPSRRGNAAAGALAAIAVLASNTLGATAATWRYNVEGLDVATFSTINGVKDERALKALYPWPDQLAPFVAFLRERQLGPFAEEETRYRPPLNSLPDGPAASLDACAGGVDGAEANADKEVHVLGWASSPDGAWPATWMFALDGGGRVLGYTRLLHARPDVRPARARATTMGFDLWFRDGAARRSDGHAHDLVAVFPGGTAAPCRLADDPASDRDPKANP